MALALLRSLVRQSVGIINICANSQGLATVAIENQCCWSHGTGLTGLLSEASTLVSHSDRSWLAAFT